MTGPAALALVGAVARLAAVALIVAAGAPRGDDLLAALYAPILAAPAPVRGMPGPAGAGVAGVESGAPCGSR